MLQDIKDNGLDIEEPDEEFDYKDEFDLGDELI